MDIHLRSARISLVSESGAGRCPNELWQTFRRTAVEPGQASSPNFISFADECLLCTYIVLGGTGGEDGSERMNGGPLWDTSAQRSLPARQSYTPRPAEQAIGIIYLHAGPANVPAGEACVGVIIKEQMRCRGYAREAVQLVLRWAFEDLKFHRVQAAILDTPFKDRALRLFIGSGFAHEGTKRRAVYQPEGEGTASVWKDVTYVAMLDTEWMLRATWKRDQPLSDRPIISVWDEMFARHSREREGLLRWEEDHGRIKKSSSTETLREYVRRSAQEMAYLSDDMSSIGEPSASGSTPPSPRPNVIVTWEDEDADMVDVLGDYEPGQRWEDIMEMTLVARRQRQGMGRSHLEPSPRGYGLALPSIPSTMITEGNPQSPLTILTPSTPGSTPPSSRSSSLSPSSAYGSWPSSEDEDNWLPRDTPLAANVPIRSTMPHDVHPRAVPTGLTRPRSSTVSSTGSWSDAQSSVSTSSGNWDVISNASAHSYREHA